MLKDPRPRRVSTSIHRQGTRSRPDLLPADPRRSAALRAIDPARKDPIPLQLPEDAVACNCAGCGVETVVDPKVAAKYHAQLVAGRVAGRPYCGHCIVGARKL